MTNKNLLPGYLDFDKPATAVCSPLDSLETGAAPLAFAVIDSVLLLGGGTEVDSAVVSGVPVDVVDVEAWRDVQENAMHPHSAVALPIPAASAQIFGPGGITLAVSEPFPTTDERKVCIVDKAHDSLC